MSIKDCEHRIDDMDMDVWYDLEEECWYSADEVEYMSERFKALVEKHPEFKGFLEWCDKHKQTMYKDGLKCGGCLEECLTGDCGNQREKCDCCVEQSMFEMGEGCGWCGLPECKKCAERLEEIGKTWHGETMPWESRSRRQRVASPRLAEMTTNQKALYTWSRKRFVYRR